jgi:hypothetical protein
MDEYGPFANIAALALALVALFSMLLLKSIGSVKRWTWLVDDSPSFLVTTGPRALTVVLMAIAYLTASESNQTWLIVAAVLCGVLCLVSIAYFDRTRRIHVVAVPLVGPDGAQLTDGRGRPLTENVVIGTEDDLMPVAKKALAKSRKKAGGVSLAGFMSGFGATKVNDPEALWERTLLARIGSRLSLTLTAIVLFAVLSLFLAALILDVSLR